MHSTRILNLLVVALSSLSVAQATFVDANVARGGHEIQRRQGSSQNADDTPADVSSSATDTDTTTSSSSISSKPTSSTDTSTTTTTSSRVSSTPTSTTTTPPTSSTPESTSTPPSSTPTTTSDGSKDTSSTETISTSTSTVTATLSNGSKTTYTTEMTTTPSANLSNSGTSQTGMSTSTRNTVIGVVVGIGGAILLGGLAFVAWRIWGRRRGQEENDGLMDYDTGYSPGDKTEQGSSVNGRTPFQSTLESYHAPTQVNQASNF